MCWERLIECESRSTGRSTRATVGRGEEMTPMRRRLVQPARGRQKNGAALSDSEFPDPLAPLSEEVPVRPAPVAPVPTVLIPVSQDSALAEASPVSRP